MCYTFHNLIFSARELGGRALLLIRTPYGGGEVYERYETFMIILTIANLIVAILTYA